MVSSIMIVIHFSWFPANYDQYSVYIRVHLVTLEDALANEVPWKLSAVWQCASRVVKATKELHEIGGIFYLRWKRTCHLMIMLQI